MSESMHSHHDPDLIAALAEGRLVDAAAAEDLVATCPECADAYRDHRLVHDTIVSAAPAVMDDLERRRLRSNVWEGIRSEPADVGSDDVPSPARSTPWWYRVAPVAAVLVVALGVASMFTGQGDGEETFDTVSGLMSAEEPTADDADTFAAEPEAFTAPATTAPADDAAAADEERAEALVAGAEPVSFSMEELEDAAADFADAVEAGEPSIDERFDCPPGDSPSDPVVAAQEADVEGTPVWFVAYGSPDDVSRVDVHRIADCTPVYRSE